MQKQIQIKRRNINVNIQELLEDSERAESNINFRTINLTGQNSIAKNKKLRTDARFDKRREIFDGYVDKFMSFAIPTVSCLAILAYVGSTISLNPQIVEAKEELLEEVTIEIKDDYTEEELFSFIEDVQETHSEPVYDYFEELTKYVSKGEGAFQYKAFCDSYYKTETGMIRKSPDHCTYWSIGYGTPSFRGEVITYEEGVKRRNEDLKRRDSMITSTCLTDNQRMVVIDFLYQHGANSSRMRYNANKCNVEGIFWTIANWRDLYKSKKKWGMVKREQMRLNKFYK